MTKGRRNTSVRVKKQPLLTTEKSAEEPDNGGHYEPEEPKLQEANDMTDLQTILQELREFRRENGESLREIKDDIKNANKRIDEAESRISETEEKVQMLDEAVLEMLKQQEKLEARLTDQEGRSRRDNVRLHGVGEGSEDNSPSMANFVENLLKEKLDIPSTTSLNIERAHRSLGPKPPPESPPRSIVVKFSSFATKEEVLKLAWQKKGFTHRERKVILDHDYAPAVLKKRREYLEAKKILRERKLRFQTPFPAKLRVFYEEETCVYDSAAEATKDMARRGLPVTVYKPPQSWSDRIKSLMWSTPRPPKRGVNSSEDPRLGYKKKLEAFKKN